MFTNAQDMCQIIYLECSSFKTYQLSKYL